MQKYFVLFCLLNLTTTGCATFRHHAAPLEGAVLVAQGAYEAFRDYGKCDSPKLEGRSIRTDACLK